MGQFPLALSIEPRLLPLAVANGFHMDSKVWVIYAFLCICILNTHIVPWFRLPQDVREARYPCIHWRPSRHNCGECARAPEAWFKVFQNFADFQVVVLSRIVKHVPQSDSGSWSLHGSQDEWTCLCCIEKVGSIWRFTVRAVVRFKALLCSVDTGRFEFIALLSKI